MADYTASFNYMMDDEDRNRTGAVVPDPSKDHPDAKARFGINSGAHPEAVAAGFFTMSTDDALQWAASFYKNSYWVPINGYRITSQDIANKFFSFSVNQGSVQATKTIQRACNSVLSSTPGFNPLVVDGVCGQHTIDAINSADSSILLQEIKSVASEFYKQVALNLNWSDSLLNALLARVNR